MLSENRVVVAVWQWWQREKGSGGLGGLGGFEEREKGTHWADSGLADCFGFGLLDGARGAALSCLLRRYTVALLPGLSCQPTDLPALPGCLSVFLSFCVWQRIYLLLYRHFSIWFHREVRTNE